MNISIVNSEGGIFGRCVLNGRNVYNGTFHSLVAWASS